MTSCGPRLGLLLRDSVEKRVDRYFSFAVLMSIINFANTLADNVGSFLYSHLFHNTLPPLVMISAAFTAFAFVLVPLLRLGDKRQGEPVKPIVEPPTPVAR